MNWKAEQKPNPHICPQAFCFFWCEADAVVADVTGEAQRVIHPHCGCQFGRCLRLYPLEGNHDWYEPHEPALAHAGLPWFYFIPAPVAVNEDLRSTYSAESEALWGTNHWRTGAREALE